MLNLREVKKEPLFSEQAYLILKEMILGMKITPNECISESNLASMIGMSRTPIREALTRLKNEAILISSGKKGYFLNIPTIKEIKDLYELRTIMECGAIKLAAPKVDLQKLENFENQFLRYKNEPSGMDDKDFDFVKLGRTFHFFIIDSTENKLVREFINGIYERLEISRVYSYNKRRDDAVDEHLKIVGALKERDPEKCQKYMEEHLKKAFNMLIKIL